MSAHHDEHHLQEQKPIAFTIPFILAAVVILVILLFVSLGDPSPHHGHEAMHEGHGAATEASHHEASAAAAGEHHEAPAQAAAEAAPAHDSAHAEAAAPAAEPAHGEHH
jgi:hypothetical protein